MKRIFTISGLVLLCFFFINSAFAQNVTIKGKVTDAATGESLIGVSVTVKGTTNGTQTDVNGAYSLSAPSTATLVYTYIGYANQEVAIGGRNTIDVKLQIQNNQLQQVVVIGYGTQRKVDNTGAIATVNGTEIAKQASTDALSALEGKVAGVEVIANGTPGSAPTINIRGLGTVFGDTKPLFVVDGTWYQDISFLNNADIESISVLKDASSTAIFGIAAANGVIIITTKHGKKGKATVNYNMYVGWQAVTNQVQMADGAEYATMINELYTTNGITPAFSVNPASYGTGTNWYDQILRNAFVTNHEISLSGATDKTNYDISFGYLDQDGIIKDNNFKRYTLRIANEFRPVKNLKLGYNLNGLSSDSHDAPTAIFHQLYTAAPIVPVFYKDGKYGDPADYNIGGGAAYNPEATIDYYNQQSKNRSFSGNVYGEYEIIPGLKFRTQAGGLVSEDAVRNYTPVYSATTTQNATQSELDLNHLENRNWMWSNTLTYDKTIGQNKFTVLLGYEPHRNDLEHEEALAQNVPYSANGSLFTSFPAGANVSYTKNYANAGDHDITTSIGEFARINYSFNDRYLLNASIRHDGASQYFNLQNPGEAWGWFPSIGGGWVISNENFMKSQNVFKTLKLRASWGQVGNVNVPQAITILQTTGSDPSLTANFGNPSAPYQGVSVASVVPPTSTWEKSQSLDLGIEGSILNDHLSFEADYYNRATQNAILQLPIAGSVGTTSTSITANEANIRNRGFEFSLTWRDQVNANWSYSISPNLGINTNDVTSVLSGSIPIYSGGGGLPNGYQATRTIAGQPIGEFYGYKVIGIFQNAAQLAQYPQLGTEQPGDFIYQSFSGASGGGQITSKDRVNLGNPNAKYGYGVNTKVNYKNWDLALDFQGRADVSVYNANLADRFGNENFTQNFYQNRWHGAGTSNSYPSVNIGSDADSAPNSFYVSSGAYFRVRNAQLGYTVKTETLKKLKIQSLRFFANAQNAINIFGYKGFSPEIGGNVLSVGIDNDVYPLYATYNFGLNVTFQ